jgi:exopolysaccharide production protein ExoQ
MNKNINKTIGIIYLFPFIIYFLVNAFAIFYTDSHQESSLVNQIMYSSSYLLAFILLISKQPQFFYYSLNKAIPLLILLFLALLSLTWTDSPRNVIVGLAHKTGTIIVAICSSILLIQNKNKFFESLIIIFLAYFLASIAFVQLRPDIAMMPAAFFGAFRAGMRGFTLHPNTLGSICMVGAWVALSGLYLIDNKKNIISFLAYSVLISLFYCLIRADSMTSILVTLGMGSIVIWCRYIQSSYGGIFILKIFFFIFCILIALTTLYIFKPEFFSIEYFFEGIGRNSSFSGRTNLWSLGLAGFYEKPFFGWGEDNLFTYLRYYNLDFTQFHNGYLDFLVRGGIVSSFLIFLLLLKVTINILSLMRENNKSYIIVVAFVFPWLVHNITEASIYRNTNILWLTFLIIYFFSMQKIYVSKNI